MFAYLNAMVKASVYFMLHDDLSLACKKPSHTFIKPSGFFSTIRFTYNYCSEDILNSVQLIVTCVNKNEIKTLINNLLLL